SPTLARHSVSSSTDPRERLPRRVREVWDEFLALSHPDAPYREGRHLTYPAPPWKFDVPISWEPFYDFVIAVHEQAELLSHDAVLELLVAAGMSEGPAEDVAWSYSVAR